MDSLPGALLSCSAKKVSKEVAGDLSYGPRTLQTTKGPNRPFGIPEGKAHNLIVRIKSAHWSFL